MRDSALDRYGIRYNRALVLGFFGSLTKPLSP
jgi:hypothetical protein